MRQAWKKNGIRFVAAATLGLCAASGSLAASGQASAGANKAAMCIGCHGIPGYQNAFPEVYKVPKISGQSAKFIESALQQYQRGERKHPTMRGIAGSLSEQDIADLAAYYGGMSQGAVVAEQAQAPVGAVAELLTKGGCVACHGANFSKPLDPSYPKLAGQHADYLYAALKAYSVEGNAWVGRSNAVMGGIAKQFSPAEMKVMAKYLAALPGEVFTQPLDRLR